MERFKRSLRDNFNREVTSWLMLTAAFSVTFSTIGGLLR